ncbi:MAG: hypothetical protein ACRCZO_14745 [Cetobacterium sp.]
MDFLCEILKVQDKTITVYIKQLYYSIENKNILTNCRKDMVVEIKNCKNLLQILKSVQAFTKDERILYIILTILIRKKTILSDLSILFDVSRRTINQDLIIIKNNLSIFNLTVNTDPGKGIFLTGSSLSIKRALCIYIYKYLVEAEELPTLLADRYNQIIAQLNLKTVDFESENFISETDLDIFFHNKSLVQAFSLSFANKKDSIDSLKKIDSNEFFENNFKSYFSKKAIKCLPELFRNSNLGNLKINDLKFLFNILNICKGEFSEIVPNLKDNIDEVIQIFKSEFFIDIVQDSFFVNLISRISFVKEQKHYLDIFEMFFLNLTLGNRTKNRCMKLFLLLRKKYPKISFSDVISLYLWGTAQEVEHKEETGVLVYKNLPQNLLPLMKENIYSKYNVIVLDCVTQKELNSFLIHNDVNRIITFEPLKIKCGEKVMYINL